MRHLTHDHPGRPRVWNPQHPSGFSSQCSRRVAHGASHSTASKASTDHTHNGGEREHARASHSHPKPVFDLTHNGGSARHRASSALIQSHSSPHRRREVLNNDPLGGRACRAVPTRPTRGAGQGVGRHREPNRTVGIEAADDDGPREQREGLGALRVAAADSQTAGRVGSGHQPGHGRRWKRVRSRLSRSTYRRRGSSPCHPSRDAVEGCSRTCRRRG